MKWAEWTYFSNNWQDDPKLDNLRRQRNAGKITRSEYKAGIELIKQDVLMRMLREGRIDVEDFMHPSPPQPQKSRKAPLLGKKVPVGKAVLAHGKAHTIPQWKGSSMFRGGLPGLAPVY